MSSEPEVIFGFRVHEFAARFPLIEGKEFEELVEDIRVNGLKKPIKLDCHGQIVDGRNRLRACREAGVKEVVESLPEDTDIVTFILQENILRRHMSVGQRAMIAEDLVTLRQAGRPKPGQGQISTSAAAEKLHVSRNAVNAAAVVKQKGIPELADAVMRNEIPVTTAAAVAKESPEVQQRVVADAAERKGKKGKRQKTSDAAFDRNKWRQRAEHVFSQTLAKAPPDLQDWARGTFRDVCGGSLRKEARLDIPDGDDVTLYDSEDVIDRIEGMLKEIPITERKDIKQAIGEHYIGQKPEQYMPGLSDYESETDKLAVVIAELKCRQKSFEGSDEVLKVLKTAVSELRKIAKSDSE